MSPGKERIENAACMQEAADKILQQYDCVKGWVSLNITEEGTERQIRAYGDRPARTEIQMAVTVQAKVEEQAVQS